MLVSVPRLCTTLSFVYISSLIFPRVSTPFLPEAEANSLSARFSPFTHTPKSASFSELSSCLGGGQINKKRKPQKKQTKSKENQQQQQKAKKSFLKIFCESLPLHLNVHGAHLLHAAFELSVSTPKRCARPALLCSAPYCADLQTALLVLGIQLCL